MSDGIIRAIRGAVGPAASHISDQARADLAKLRPEHRQQILRVADRKEPARPRSPDHPERT
jgi:hypothetical protein